MSKWQAYSVWQFIVYGPACETISRRSHLKKCRTHWNIAPRCRARYSIGECILFGANRSLDNKTHALNRVSLEAINHQCLRYTLMKRSSRLCYKYCRPLCSNKTNTQNINLREMQAEFTDNLNNVDSFVWVNWNAHNLRIRLSL